MKSFLLFISILLIASCASPTFNIQENVHEPVCTGYMAVYSFSLQEVERPEKADQRYGSKTIDILNNDKKYKFYFEDEMMRISWDVNVMSISFSLQNKTEHSIKIPWDEAAYVDENGRSHRVLHGGVKYSDRGQPMPPSVITRMSIFEDTVFPADYIDWNKGSGYSAGNWSKKSLFSPTLDIICKLSKGVYWSFEDFDKAAKSNIGKTFQVLIPVQIENTVNEYIFIFKIEDVSTRKEMK
jgi:hypothetical protein